MSRGFLATDAGQQWMSALLDSGADSVSMAIAVAHAAYADDRGRLVIDESTEEHVYALALAVMDSQGVETAAHS